MSRHDPERERHWHTVLTQWHQSEQTISAFCKQRHLSKPTFGYWQRKLNGTYFLVSGSGFRRRAGYRETLGIASRG